MVRVSRPWVGAKAVAAGACGLLAAGCVCPPCPVSPASIAVGTTELLWEGDGTHSGAQGWTECDQKAAGCESLLMAEAGVGKDGTRGLHFKVNGQGWFGMGWNFFGWWPQTAGVDITPYNTLTFAMRVEAASPDQAPDVSSLTTHLICSRDTKATRTVNIEPWAGGATDGQWHTIEVPLAELYKGEGAEFDPGSAWEFDFGLFLPNKRSFSIYFDDIAVVKK